MDYVHIDERKTKEPLPYNFTAYIETKDKIYRFEFRFNITANYYPFIELWHTYVPNATYYCYIPLENKVVISDHIVEGTKYFFVEKDGKLSRIVDINKYHYGKSEFLGREIIGPIYYFSEVDLKYSLGNRTMLGRCWMDEFLENYRKGFEWENYSVTIYPVYIVGNGTSETLCLSMMLDAKDNVGYVRYDLNALNMVRINGAYFSIKGIPQENPLENGKNYTTWYEDYIQYRDKVGYKFGFSNFTFVLNSTLKIELWNVNIFNFTIDMEVEKPVTSYYSMSYKMEWKVVVENKEYPFLSPQNITGGKYFCYLPAENNVVISDHIVEGTKYFFVEKDGFLSRIVEAKG